MTSRLARCNQVTTMISSPTDNPSIASAANLCTSSQTSGAPSVPCLGASLRDLMLERITPMGRSWAFSTSLTPDFFRFNSLVIFKNLS